MTVAMIADVLDQMDDALVLLDPSGRVVTANASAQDRFGDWIVGQPYVSAMRQPAVLRVIDASYKDLNPLQAEVIHAAGDVESRLILRTAPLYPEGPDSRHLLLIFRDTSDVWHREAMHRDFVANVSHELKTPLTGILGFIETLEGPARDDPPAAQRFLSLMRLEAERMSRLVSDLLSLSRVESQSRRRPTQRVDLADLAKRAARPLADRMTVTFDLPDVAPINGDADQLIQVVTNLLENANRYGGGAAHIGIRRNDRDVILRRAVWVLTVCDDGPGIDPEHLPRLTERFYRVDAHRSRAGGGTGLGLAIVKHIVQRHGGRMKIVSAKGQGTEVRVHLPAV